MNPVLPPDCYIPDVEARVWQDGRMVLYGSCDIPGSRTYCSREYRVFSSEDLNHWTDHGVSFRAKDAHSGPNIDLYAPDCVCVDGQYRLYYCGSDRSEGVAFSDSPFGPFTQAQAVDGANEDGIDPAVLIDADGSAYLFWGQRWLRGARLNDDGTALVMGTFEPTLLTQEEHGFHEGASIRKINDRYCLIYADLRRGKPTCLSCAVSDHPLGPYEYRGVIIDNDGCDPDVWNNHGSLVQWNDQWYVWYHRSSQNSRMNRRACMEPITVLPDGTIPEVPMTLHGPAQPPSATRRIEAFRATRLFGSLHSRPTRDDQGNREEPLSGVQAGNWAEFRAIDFDETVYAFSADIQGAASITVRMDHPETGDILCVTDRPAEPKTERRTVRAALDRIPEGPHPVYLCFDDTPTADFKLYSFHFSKETS